MFETIREELDRLPENGRAHFWWRDDDATKAHPELSDVLEIAKEFDIPIHLSVIPALQDPTLSELITDTTAIIFQHGYSHENHDPHALIPNELSSVRPLSEIAKQLEEGRGILEGSFGERFKAVFVPPWSQIRPDLISDLRDMGFIGISSHRVRHVEFPWPGFKQINTHVDLINWKNGSGFVGGELACSRIAAHLASKRLNIVDDREPTGILTHHKAHDDELSRFLPKLMAFLSAHQKVQWVTPFSEPIQGAITNGSTRRFA